MSNRVGIDWTRAESEPGLLCPRCSVALGYHAWADGDRACERAAGNEAFWRGTFAAIERGAWVRSTCGDEPERDR